MPSTEICHSGSILYQKKRRPRKKFTPDEDKQLRDLVGDQMNPVWEQIAEKIPGRTARQCRDRYHHYLAPGVVQDPWSHEEDEKLKELYTKHGSNWSLIAKYFGGRRTNNHIKNRWNNHLRKDFVSYEPPACPQMEVNTLYDLRDIDFLDGFSVNQDETDLI